jgi:hypothetical protein
MLGPEEVTRTLVRRLRTAMPDRLTMLRARYDTTLAKLPDVAKIEPDELDVMTLEDFPAIFAVPLDTSGRLDNRQTETTGDYDEYSFTYNMRIFVYARSGDYKTTSLLTKRYTLAVRECLLAGKQLTEGDENLTIEPKTLRESYSQVSQLPDSKKYLSGAYLDVQIVSEERIYSTIEPVEAEIISDVHVVAGVNKALPDWNLDV